MTIGWLLSMAKRTVAFCNGRYIGIESIYTVVDGKQINIPDKLKELRDKGKNNELFCPCGCGTNLIVVAGDKNLKEQHFRIKDSQNNENCTAITEGMNSINSKIVLKCWLDDNLHTDDLESRVPICDVADVERRYEFTFLSKKSKIALDYCNDRANLSDEKQSVLEQNSIGIHIIHVVDITNGCFDGQYPEGLMKIQNKQRYCLLLSVVDEDYDKAKMIATCYEQDIDGLWCEIVFGEGLLKDYVIDANGKLILSGKSLEGLFDDAMSQFNHTQEAEKARREEEKKRIAELKKQQKIETEKRMEEYRKQQEMLAEKKRIEAEENAKKLAKQDEERKLIIAKLKAIQQQRKEEFQKLLPTKLEQQEFQVRDVDGNRWIKCEVCGKIAIETEFSTYGGPGHINLGTCKECYDNNPAVKMALLVKSESKADEKKYDPSLCPECDGRLIERNSFFGKYMRCSNYPGCRYTREID